MRGTLLITLGFVGAAGAAVGAQTGVVRSRHGDTAVVSTQGNGRWGAPHDAIEVLRLPGDTRETTFGAAYVLQATPDGGVVVADTKSLDGLIVRQFDRNGKFVRNLGRSGPGPGEYMRQNLTIAVHPNGTIFLRDSEKSVTIFGPDGKLVNSFALFHGNGSTNEITVARDGSFYIRAPFLTGADFSTGGPGLQRPMLHYTVAGNLLDSVSSTTHWLPLDAEGAQWWRILPDGRDLYTRTDKVGFLVVSRRGNAAPLIGEAPGAPLPYLREEREELQSARDLLRDKCPRPNAQPTPRTIIPEFKLPARGASVDIDGRIWIAKSATAQRIPAKIIASCSGPAGRFKVEATYEEPPVFAAFQADGTYLGEVRFPLRARVTFVGNTAWALVPDSDDVQTLVKYRLY
jgi:hypothetical protein